LQGKEKIFSKKVTNHRTAEPPSEMTCCARLHGIEGDSPAPVPNRTENPFRRSEQGAALVSGLVPLLRTGCRFLMSGARQTGPGGSAGLWGSPTKHSAFPCHETRPAGGQRCGKRLEDEDLESEEFVTCRGFGAMQPGYGWPHWSFPRPWERACVWNPRGPLYLHRLHRAGRTTLRPLGRATWRRSLGGSIWSRPASFKCVSRSTGFRPNQPHGAGRSRLWMRRWLPVRSTTVLRS